MIEARHQNWFLLPIALLTAILVYGVSLYGAQLVVSASLGAIALVFLFVFPDMAALAAVFILYSNLAVVSEALVSYPVLAASVIALSFIIPLVYLWIVRGESLKTDRVFLCMWLFLAVQLASAFSSKNGEIALQRILGYLAEGVLLYFFVLNVVRHKRNLHGTILAILLAGALLGGLSLYQAVTHSYDQQFGGLAQRNLEFELERGVEGASAGVESAPRLRLADRAAGSLGDPNRYAQILLVLLPLAVYQFWRSRSLAWRAATAAIIGLLLSGIVLSYSRGTFVTLALLFVLLVSLGFIRLKVALAVLVLTALLLPVAAPSYYDRIATLLDIRGLVSETPGIEMDQVIPGRATEMLASFQVFLDHPILGVGPGQYMPFYSERYQLDPDVQLRYLARRRRAHNLFSEIAAETGFVGLAVFSAMPLLWLRGLWRAYRRWARVRQDLSNLAAAFFFSIIAYLGTGLFLHLAFERYYWLLLALSGAALQILWSEVPAMKDSGRAAKEKYA